ncbi:hypothetical protein OSCT_0719 [Oscillochloris trichoides DG-6]|uniref:Glycosyltransferase 2-like domain-containing protein n=1 Tax=Oscillochloris trichoides DG-6 TaxID=765420 RepID=E1IBL8_9CHLR|nr:glycosyltransferase [Oscillochloris trichoides]EFO81437.1 hypothetical protein OSCT_0719 [Oscillochloris trichoides DG-6]
MISPPRSNRAAALNAGIAQVQGAFVATLNAQMCPMPNWLDLLLAACDDPQVVAVFGSHQTLTLETSAQVLVDRVEAARPQPPRRMTPGWLREAPGNPVAWAIRGADHALFRTRLFADSQVGRFGEHYDPPTFYGVSEAYLCYRLLRAGYTLAHVPEAYVWRSPPPNPVMAQARIEADTTARTALDLLLLLIERDPAARWRLITAPRSYLRTCTAWLTATLRGRSQPAARLIRLRGALRSVVWLAQAHLLQRREPH